MWDRFLEVEFWVQEMQNTGQALEAFCRVLLWGVCPLCNVSVSPCWQARGPAPLSSSEAILPTLVAGDVTMPGFHLHALDFWKGRAALWWSSPVCLVDAVQTPSSCRTRAHFAHSTANTRRGVPITGTVPLPLAQSTQGSLA